MSSISPLDRWHGALRAGGKSKGTAATRRSCVLAVSNAVGVHPENLTAELLGQHFAHAGYRTWTRRAYVASLKQWAAFLNRPELVAGIGMPSVPRAIPRPVPEKDLQLLVSYLCGRERLWVLLGAYAGLRSHEVAQLKWADVLDFGSRTMLRIHGKGDVIDLVPCPPILTAELAAVRPPHTFGYVFPSDRSPDGHVSSHWVSRRIRKRGEQIGLTLRFHWLRHRYGTAVQRARGNLQLTQQRMRHRSPMTTTGYALLADDEGHAVVDELPGAITAVIPTPRTPVEPQPKEIEGT